MEMKPVILKYFIEIHWNAFR